MIVNSLSGQVKLQNKNLRVTSWVFCMMKISSSPTPVREATAPPLH
jgi:hypothetical protein